MRKTTIGVRVMAASALAAGLAAIATPAPAHATIGGCFMFNR
jgi:hypothetical protein